MEGLPRATELALGGIDSARSKEELFAMYDLAQKSFLALAGYFREKVSELRLKPRDNLLSALIQAEEQGDRLT